MMFNIVVGVFANVWGFLKDLFTVESVWMLVFIFCSRIVEVAIGTVRVILINKGYRKIGVILSFIEVLIWVFVASGVLKGISEEPLKGVVYSLGFAAGVYAGSKIENALAFGKVLIQVITTTELGVVICEILRAQGIGVTSIVGEGKDSPRKVLIVYANRRGKDNIINKIQTIDPKAMVVSNEVNTLQGGYINALRRFFK